MIKFPRKPHSSKFKMRIEEIKSIFRFNILNRIEGIYFSVKNYFRNIWIFRKALSSHVNWDYGAILYFLELSIDDIRKNIQENGSEIAISRDKKVQKMARAVEILSNIREDRYVIFAESELGEIHMGNTWFESYKDEISEDSDEDELFTMKDDLTEEQKNHNSAVFHRSREIEKSEWKELFVILCGQDDFPGLEDPEKFEDYEKSFEEYSDGSGIKTWWD